VHACHSRGDQRTAGGLQACARSSSASQHSEVEGAGKSARVGRPNQPLTNAVKKALSLQNPEVFGTLAQLGSVQDTGLAELLCAHVGATLRTLVVATSDTRCVPQCAPRALTAHAMCDGLRRAALAACPARLHFDTAKCRLLNVC
jgi:hypothetical protein